MAIMVSRAARVAVLLGVATIGSVESTIGQNADQTSRGRATAVTDVSLTIQTAAGVLTFAVDDKTIVQTQAVAPPADNRVGQANARLTALIQSGQDVVVVHHTRNGTSVATRINRSSATAATPAIPPKIMVGTVKSITASALVLRVREKDAHFMVDPKTIVIRGDTESPGAGGAKPVVAIRIGDAVRVSYRTTGNGMRALEIRVAAPDPS